MVISPPFLPLPIAGETEAQWFARAMNPQPAKAAGVDASEGSFPVSALLMWHNGIHLMAPPAPGGVLPVRAIADGKVIYLREPTKFTTDAKHPQNCSPNDAGPCWTDNGCVILEHNTDIGTTGEVATSFVYYSLTMHLSALDPAVKLNASIYRKDIVGQAGNIYGRTADIHLEICCDDIQIKRLIGRDPVWVPPFDRAGPKSDGRTDAVFGDLFICLPATTATSATEPKSSDIPLRSQPGLSQTLGKAQWVSIRYEKGQGYISSLEEDGAAIGTVQKAVDFEYDLYHRACALHKKAAPHVQQGQSCPSAWYELLRFRRNLGPDQLPANAAHWREIPTANGTIWADLNSLGTCKFSDADFLPVADWNFFSDDTDHLDQRCDSSNLKRWIRDPNPQNEDRHKPGHLPMRIGEAQVKTRLRRAICKFPTEWDGSTFEIRHRWMPDPKKNEHAGTKEQWVEFLRYGAAMCLPNLPAAYLNAQWRFHPVEFIQMMGRVGWLSKDEVSRCFTGVHVSPKIILDRLENSVKLNALTGGRPTNLHAALQRMLRKYLINTSAKRTAHFLGQISEETGNLESTVEKGDDRYFDKYEPDSPRGKALGNSQKGDGKKFKGRGLIQLTGSDNYTKFSQYKENPDFAGAQSERLALEAELACDAAGFYWASKQRYNKGKNGTNVENGKRGINFWCDQGMQQADAQQVTKCINGPMLHFLEVRWPSFVYALNMLDYKA